MEQREVFRNYFRNLFKEIMDDEELDEKLKIVEILRIIDKSIYIEEEAEIKEDLKWFAKTNLIMLGIDVEMVKSSVENYFRICETDRKALMEFQYNNKQKEETEKSKLQIIFDLVINKHDNELTIERPKQKHYIK